MRFELRPIIRVDPRDEIGCREGLLRIKPEDLRSVVASLRDIVAGIPFEGYDSSGRQCFLQSGLALKESRLVMAPFFKERSKNERAKRNGQNSGLRRQDALFH